MPARRTSTLNDSAPAAKKKGRKGLKSFIENIKGKWSERKEIAERTISNNNAQNEQKIIEVLESIDFIDSIYAFTSSSSALFVVICASI